MENLNEQLLDACLMGQTELVKLLIDKGADIGAKDEYGNTPLHYACIKGHIEIAELLISKGVDINAKDKWGNTSLHSAYRNGQTDVIELLISKGADIEAENYFHQLPFYVANNNLATRENQISKELLQRITESAERPLLEVIDKKDEEISLLKDQIKELDLSDKTKEKLISQIEALSQVFTERISKISSEIKADPNIKKLVQDVGTKIETLETTAYTDNLTGLQNRHGLNKFLQNNKGHYVPSIIDIDHFKAVNDTLGHDTGDTVLKDVANIIRGREGARAYRLGGEEFAVMINSNADKNSSAIFSSVDDIRKDIANTKIIDKPVTVSIGVSSSIVSTPAKEGIDNSLFKSALKNADENLYEAKNSGRNKVICDSSELQKSIDILFSKIKKPSQNFNNNNTGMSR